MNPPRDQAVAFEPLHVVLASGHSLSGLWLRGAGRLTVLFLHDHDHDADLDAVLPLLAQMGMPEAHKIALDLPGHGLSEGAPEHAAQALSMFCDRLGAEGQGPFVVVGCGRSAGLAWTLGSRGDVLGTVLVSPDFADAGVTEPEPFRRTPVLVFLAAASPEFVAAWTALRARLRARWLSVSLAVTHEDLLALRGCDRQIASHLAGFARELMANAPAPNS